MLHESKNKKINLKIHISMEDELNNPNEDKQIIKINAKVEKISSTLFDFEKSNIFKNIIKNVGKNLI